VSGTLRSEGRRDRRQERAAPIEVFADLTCPFTHVGLRRLVQRRGALGRDDVRFWVRAWPLELVNGSPLRADAVVPDVTALRVHVAPDLFAGFDPDRFPPTSLPALGLAARAYELGPDAGEEVSLLLRDALFEQGCDLADPEVLDGIAHQCGVPFPPDGDHDRVLVDWHEGRRRRVVGSPHFFVGDQSWFCPSLRISHDEAGELRIVADEEGFEHLVAACFPGAAAGPGA
jgi:2-hydroxychromene-2-carboxylate isomerase